MCGDNVEPCGLCVDHVCTGEPECCSDADCTQVEVALSCPLKDSIKYSLVIIHLHFGAKTFGLPAAPPKSLEFSSNAASP